MSAINYLEGKNQEFMKNKNNFFHCHDGHLHVQNCLLPYKMAFSCSFKSNINHNDHASEYSLTI